MKFVVKRASSFAVVMGLSLAALAGCGPSKTIVEADIQASADLNPDRDGRASPLVVTMYQLKSPVAFNNASFFSLFDKPQAELGADFQGKEEIELRPGQKLKIERELNPQTRYLGFLAGYRNIERSTWRAVTPVEAGSTTEIKVDFARSSVTTKTID